MSTKDSFDKGIELPDGRYHAKVDLDGDHAAFVTGPTAEGVAKKAAEIRARIGSRAAPQAAAIPFRDCDAPFLEWVLARQSTAAQACACAIHDADKAKKDGWWTCVEGTHEQVDLFVVALREFYAEQGMAPKRPVVCPLCEGTGQCDDFSYSPCCYCDGSGEIDADTDPESLLRLIMSHDAERGYNWEFKWSALMSLEPRPVHDQWLLFRWRHGHWELRACSRLASVALEGFEGDFDSLDVLMPRAPEAPWFLWTFTPELADDARERPVLDLGCMGTDHLLAAADGQAWMNRADACWVLGEPTREDIGS
jgi:hypothetical protein